MADWMPDGGALSVEMVFGRKGNQTGGPRGFSFVLREGSGPGGRLGGVGGATDMFAEWRAMRAGGELEFWDQPSYGRGAGGAVRMGPTQGWARKPSQSSRD